MSTPTGYINGSDLLLLVGTSTPFGHCTTHTLTFNSETKDRAVKPLVSVPYSASSGLFKSKSVTGLSVTVSAEGLRFYDETETGFKTLLNKWKSGEAIALKGFHRANATTNPYFTGNFVITSLEETSPAADDTTYKVTFENDGPVTIDESKCGGTTEETEVPTSASNSTSVSSHSS